ncbi:hypothetical protein ILYODFUR_005069 [Ilyodon furcidens]|uniref:Uncharacterized protein n=1 Tax=Ilyodon furcidens TaxID=33524 RepID=A0ABV0SJT2_9TELE
MASPCLPALPSPAAGSLLMPSGGTARLVRVVPHHPGSCNVGGRHPWVYQRFDLEGITLLDIKSAAE